MAWSSDAIAVVGKLDSAFPWIRLQVAVYKFDSNKVNEFDSKSQSMSSIQVAIDQNDHNNKIQASTRSARWLDEVAATGGIGQPGHFLATCQTSQLIYLGGSAFTTSLRLSDARGLYAHHVLKSHSASSSRAPTSTYQV